MCAKQIPRNCLCQEVVAFNVPSAARFICAEGKEMAWRHWIKAGGNGCNDRNLNFPGGKQLACSHVRRSKIPHEMLVVLDRGKDVIMLSKVLFILILVYPGEGATLPCE